MWTDRPVGLPRRSTCAPKAGHHCGRMWPYFGQWQLRTLKLCERQCDYMQNLSQYSCCGFDLLPGIKPKAKWLLFGTVRSGFHQLHITGEVSHRYTLQLGPYALTVSKAGESRTKKKNKHKAAGRKLQKHNHCFNLSSPLFPAREH